MFTDTARLVFDHVRQRTAARGITGEVPVLMILWSIARWERKLATQLIEDCGVDTWALERRIDEELHILVNRRSGRTKNRELRFDFRKIVQLVKCSRKEADSEGKESVGIEHILIALAKSRDPTVRGLFREFGITARKMTTELAKHR
jgi:ATP-dependent Clp protease ATP-binding subunit ClpA